MVNIMCYISFYLGIIFIIALIIWLMGYLILSIIDHYSKIISFFIVWIPQIKKNPYNIFRIIKDGNGDKWVILRYDEDTKKLLEKQQK